MLREAQTFEAGNARSPFAPGTIAVGGQTEAPAVSPESAEHEINRLTWAVLDGSASLSDRQRLAMLVNAQHAVRRRFDR